MATTEVARCVVHVDSLETAYMRAGSGSPLVVLLECPETIDGLESLVAALCPNHRLTIPSLETAVGTQGLRTFLDGIGLMHTSLLAIDRWAIPALAFALSEPHRVERLALLESRPGGYETCQGSIERMGETGQPLFVALGGAYYEVRSGFLISPSMADGLIHFFSGVVRDTA